MSYNVTIYKDTGFVGGNIPDSPALLGAGVSKQAVEILQDGELSSIKLSIEWAEAKLVDYIKVGSVYYMVEGRRMLATDVCEFDILEDGISTIGGVSQIQVLDGITERCHLPSSADGDKDDPLLAPQEPLVLETQLMKNPINESIVMIEATLSPTGTYHNKAAIEYSGTNTTVAVPQAAPYDENDVTLYEMKTYYKNGQGTVVEETDASNRATALEIMSTKTISGGSVYGEDEQGNSVELEPKNDIVEAVSYLRSLGLESAIIGQIEYPVGMVDVVVSDGGPQGQPYLSVKKVKSKSGAFEQADDLPFIYANNVNNDLLFVSDFTKYGLLTASGAKAEFTVKSIKDPSKTFAQQSYPRVDYMTDPNPDGKPYFRYQFFNGNSSKLNFLANALPGLSWKQVPIVFTGKSGAELDKIQFETERYLDERNFQANRLANNIKTLTSLPVQAAQGVTFSQGNPAWLATNMAGVAGSLIDRGVDNLYENETYRNQKYKSLVNYELSQVASPQLNFPYESEPLRLQMNNGVYAYRYKYSANDLARIDKLITMYGVKTTQALTPSMFTSRRYFNFVKCDDVTVIGNTKHLNEVVSAQLRGGVRIWHVKPDPAKYLTENI